KTSRVKNGFGTLWIGNIIDALGEDWEKLRCRGEIIGYHIKNNLLTIYQSTAWCEQEGFRECIEKKFPSIKVYYREEEPGCDVYYTNDAYRNYFPERYLLNNNDEPLYFNTIEEAAEYVSGIVNQKVEANMTAIEKALDNFEEENEDDDVYFSFHQIQVVDD
ncbi:MAG: hypothetical protein IIT55_08400, partial [Bacteroidaceae bacterium]|nr:hypothetical protein [Bacteroidaceae bacterium]